VVIGQSLHWLGVVDIGQAGTGGAAIRVTADGARLLRDQPLPTTASAPHIVVQPNFQIFAFEPTDESVLFTLDQLADRVRAEQVVEYQLSRDSVTARSGLAWMRRRSSRSWNESARFPCHRTFGVRLRSGVLCTSAWSFTAGCRCSTRS